LVIVLWALRAALAAGDVSPQQIGLLPLIVGGGGLAGLGALIATLYTLRANRDDTIARAAKTLVEGQGAYADDLKQDLEKARAEIRELTEKVEALTTETRAARQDANNARAERDEALTRVEELAVILAGRRRGDDHGPADE
jgi:uncharacterized protein (DUF3084 family)